MSLFCMLCFYFWIYSFLGWIIEGLFNLSTKGIFIKPNFLILPLKPMYGLASVLLILWKSHTSFGFFLLGALFIPSCTEYLTAYWMDHSLHLKYWDYASCPYHLSGYVCLKFSIYWFFLSLILIYGIHPLIIKLYHLLGVPLAYSFPLLFLIFLVDCFLSVKHKVPTISSPKSTH